MQWYKSSASLSQDLSLSLTKTPSALLKQNKVSGHSALSTQYLSQLCEQFLLPMIPLFVLYRVWVPHETQDDTFRNQHRFRGRGMYISVLFLLFLLLLLWIFPRYDYGFMIKSS